VETRKIWRIPIRATVTVPARGTCAGAVSGVGAGPPREKQRRRQAPERLRNPEGTPGQGSG